MSAIVGYSGFVGLNLLKHVKFDYLYNSKNFKDAKNKTFDTMYFCGIPAVKWYANKNPHEDIGIIIEIKNILKTIQVNRFILISTIDVYEDSDVNVDEDYDCVEVLNNHYGRNRLFFEFFIRKTFTTHHIIRLPALFGKGLKKNIIYDLMNSNQIENIPLNSSFQWYDLEWLNTDIDKIVDNNLPICNLFTEPIPTIKILNLFDNPSCNMDKTIKYNIRTKYSKLFNCSKNGYVRSADEVETSIKRFVKFAKIDKSRLCVSNICMKDISHVQFAGILKLYGIPNVQIAPTTLIDWVNMDYINMSAYKDLNIYSFQSITYNLNELNIFSDKRIDLMAHLTKVIDLASKNNIKLLVFGCPKNRRINTIYEIEIFIQFFRDLGDYCSTKNVVICIEPNSKKYGCNFINTIEEAGNIVRQINNPNIKMMVDIGNVIMESDNLQTMNKFADIIHNIDVSQEMMRSFITPHPRHYTFKLMLNDIKYDKMINLEMCNVDLHYLCESLDNFINIYGNL
jgi:sugar phosphate isomerase/epimerase